MVFSSVAFLFVFLPSVLAAYFLIPQHMQGLRNKFLLLVSLAFYAYGEPVFVLVMLLSIVINYAGGLMISRARNRAPGKSRLTQNRARLALTLTVIGNLAILIYFKYTVFLAENVSALLKSSWALPDIVMPLGISFLTFQGMSYVFDVYYGLARVQTDPLDLALYIAFFPKLISGPIVRYADIDAEIVQRRENVGDIALGIRRFMLGLGKKLLLANTMGMVADGIFGLDVYSLTPGLAWLGGIAYGLQIYYDFSGYSDMAIGLGMIFGFHFRENFNHPYISRSLTEFWRRWHISLGSWFRNYVYIPLGGNRSGKARHIANILIVWMLTGIWHGAAWNFLLWGLYFAIILIAEKEFLLKFLDRLPTFVSHFYAVALIIIGWIIFRSPSFDFATAYMARLFAWGSASEAAGNLLVYYWAQYKFTFMAALIFCLPVHSLLVRFVERMSSRGQISPVIANVGEWAEVIFSLAVFGLSIVWLINSSFNPFIYFRF